MLFSLIMYSLLFTLLCVLFCAGVQQHILVHDFQSVLTHGGPQQQQQQPAAADGSSDALLPLLDLPTGSKISCLSFSPAVQQYLLSSDYAGVVQLWDLTGWCAAADFFLLRLKVATWLPGYLVATTPAPLGLSDAD
jgi:hypothetical protein